jgi:hypothetical protein
MLGPRLDDTLRAALVAPDTGPAGLVEAMSASGVLAPSTVMGVLHHEGVDASSAAGLVPAIGMPVPDAIRELHDRWGMDRLAAGAHLSATPDELRQAGCSTVELLRAAPREVLRRLDTREHSWELAGHSLLEAGLSTPEAVRQLALHAPTAETFAAAVHSIEADPHLVFPVAAREASGPDLVVLSERYGLSPAETAEILTAACAPPAVVTDVVAARCDGDVTAAIEACRGVLDPDAVERALRHEPLLVEPTRLPAATTADLDDAALAAALGDPAAGADLAGDEALVAALDATGTGCAEPVVGRDGRG